MVRAALEKKKPLKLRRYSIFGSFQPTYDLQKGSMGSSLPTASPFKGSHRSPFFFNSHFPTSGEALKGAIRVAAPFELCPRGLGVFAGLPLS